MISLTGFLSRCCSFFFSRVFRARHRTSGTPIGRFWQLPTLLSRSARRKTGYRFLHIAAFSLGNAGDILLPVVLRDLFDHCLGPSDWAAHHVHDPFLAADARLAEISGRAIVIGGGGLFLRDSNPNRQSGWQWSASIDAVEAINTPFVLFAVGYNRFRNQPDFDPIFTEHVNKVAEKSIFFGLRNQGSIDSLKQYLRPDLHCRLSLQPCMTTLLRDLYPKKFVGVESDPQRISFNIAWDRANLRFGTRSQNFLTDLAKMMSYLHKRGFIVDLALHTRGDATVARELCMLGAPINIVRLYNCSASRVIDYYARVGLTVGTRGHGQMIPFGCGNAIISIISHDKLAWFLEDNDLNEFGIDISDRFFYEKLIQKIEANIENRDIILEKLKSKREFILETTISNLDYIKKQVFH